MFIRTQGWSVTDLHPAQHVLEVPNFPDRSPFSVPRWLPDCLCGTETIGGSEAESFLSQCVGSGGLCLVLLGIRHLV